MGLLTGAYEQGLKALNRVKHQLQGEPTELALLSLNPTTREMESFSTINDAFDKGQLNIGLGVYVEEFRVAENAMSEEDRKKLAAVRFGDRVYSIGTAVPPNGTTRYWSLRVKPSEQVTG